MAVLVRALLFEFELVVNLWPNVGHGVVLFVFKPISGDFCSAAFWVFCPRMLWRELVTSLPVVG